MNAIVLFMIHNFFIKINIMTYLFLYLIIIAFICFSIPMTTKI
jgi:hypothetical protein